MGKLIAALLCISFGLVFSGCSDRGGSKDNPGDNTQQTRQWTYMVYMGGDNNLSDAATGDIGEMASVGSDSNVAIVVQAEFSQQYSSTAVPSDTRRMLIQKNVDNIAAGTGIGNVDMGNPATLTAFINWAKITYPAQHYALVIWDHGAGWRAKKLGNLFKGAVQDATSGSFMSLPDLAKGVKDSGLHFDIINFDACLMAMYEVAYEFRGSTDYMVFSEETEPGDGDPYDTILAALTGSPTMNSGTLANLIVDKYAEFYAPDSRQSTTKSAVDMSQVDALDAKILNLASGLKADSYGSVAVLAAEDATQSYAYPENHDIYDLCQYLSSGPYSSSLGAAVKTAAGEIMTLMGSVVIDSKYTGTETAGSHGLAIYLPKASQTDSSTLSSYSQLACNLTSRASASGTWGEYIESLIGAGGGTATYGTGNFAFYVYWTKLDGTVCNSDLDLYVFEPTIDGSSWDVYAPWMGQTTPNGFFSPDSSVSGKSEEYYVANDQVYKGDYLFLVNYYANGSGCTQAEAHVLIADPSYFGDSNWHEPYTPVTMDLSNPAPGTCNTLSCLDSYSDWWYAGDTTRSMGAGLFSTDGNFPIAGKRNQLIIQYRKGSRLYGIGR